jgi:hypothetical protein
MKSRVDTTAQQILTKCLLLMIFEVDIFNVIWAAKSKSAPFVHIRLIFFSKMSKWLFLKNRRPKTTTFQFKFFAAFP